MINNILTNPAECKLIPPNLKTELQAITPANENITRARNLSIFIISESVRTIIFSGLQFTNTIRSLEYFYPSLDENTISKISIMAEKIVELINQYYDGVKIFFSENSKKENLPQNLEMNRFRIFVESLKEQTDVNNLINSFNYNFKRQAVLALAEGTRKQIGKVVLKFQEENLINQKQIEMETYRLCNLFSVISSQKHPSFFNNSTLY